MRYCSRFPAAVSPSTSMASRRARTASRVSRFATPSSQRTATSVPLRRPTTVWRSLRVGVRSRRRTREVLVRSVSTKASLAPLMVFSAAGGEIERLSVLRTSKLTAFCVLSNTTAQQPCSRSFATSSGFSRRRTLQAHTAPSSSASTHSSASSIPDRRPASVRGQSTSSATFFEETSPSIQQTETPSHRRCPGQIARHSKSAQSENRARSASASSASACVEKVVSDISEVCPLLP